MKTYKIQILAILSVIAFGCSEPDYPQPKPSVIVQNGKIASVNSVAKRDTVDVTLDNNIKTPLIDNLKFSAAAIAYKNVQAGPNRLVEYLNAKNDTTFFTDRFSVVAGTAYTSIFYKLVALTNGKVAYSVRRMTDNVALPDPGTAKVRFFNFLFDSVTVTPPSLKLTNVGGTTTYFTTRAYAVIPSADFSVLTTLGATNYEIRDAADNILLTKSLNFASKGIYTVIVRGLVDGTGPTAIDVTLITH